MAIDPKSIKSRTKDGDSISYFSPKEMAAAEAEAPISNRRKLAAARLAAAGRIRVSLTRKLNY